MGACFSSSNGASGYKAPSKTPRDPFMITLAFPGSPPYSFNVSPSEKVSDIRKKAITEMARRAQSGVDSCKIDGTIVTADGDTGENVDLQDSMTISEAQLEPNQYLWFHDKAEESRVQNLLLRSSRLTDNTSHNSRGVKQGMMLLKEEDDAVAY